VLNGRTIMPTLAGRHIRFCSTSRFPVRHRPGTALPLAFQTVAQLEELRSLGILKRLSILFGY